METPSTEPGKMQGFFKTFLIAVLACFIVLGLAVGGTIAYFAYTNPKVLQGGPKALLESVTINKEMPTAATITSEQIACAVEKLGQARVNEIKAGASIGPADIVLAGNCF